MTVETTKQVKVRCTYCNKEVDNFITVQLGSNNIFYQCKISKNNDSIEYSDPKYSYAFYSGEFCNMEHYLEYLKIMNHIPTEESK